jgi:hypothetical protein
LVTQAVPKHWFNSVVIERGVDGFDYLLIVHKKSERLIAGGSVTNALHVFEQHFLPTPIIKLGRPAIGVSSNSLRDFEATTIFQICSDTGRPERVRRKPTRNVSVLNASAYHRCSVSPA